MNHDGSSALDGGLGRALLRAGQDEWPSDDALSRTLTAVGAGAAVVAVTGGAAASAGASAGTAVKSGAMLVSFGTVMKWLGVGAVSGVVVAGVAHELTPPLTPRLDAQAPIAAPPAPVHGAAEKARPTAKSEAAPPSEPIAEPAKPSAFSHPAAHAPADDTESHAPLAAEVALVDRARALLASGNPGPALEELGRYETVFPEPRLEPEVLFLRMEAHLAAGNTTRARETAEQSVRLFPRSPHAARAREVIGKYLGGAAAPPINRTAIEGEKK